MSTMLRALFGALALGAIATPAAAEDVSVTVYYGDLNLSNDRGMKTLKNRVDGAIRQVCGSLATRSIGELHKTRKCRRSLRNQAKVVLSEIGQGTVTVATSFAIFYRG